MLYTILVLFMALLLSFLYSMQNKKNILDKLKAEVVEAFYCNGIDNIEDLTGATVIATTVESNDDNFLITIPKEGHYDTSSKLSVPISEINNALGDIANATIGETFTDNDTNLASFVTTKEHNKCLIVVTLTRDNTSLADVNVNFSGISATELLNQSTKYGSNVSTGWTAIYQSDGIPIGTTLQVSLDYSNYVGVSLIILDY